MYTDTRPAQVARPRLCPRPLAATARRTLCGCARHSTKTGMTHGLKATRAFHGRCAAGAEARLGGGVLDAAGLGRGERSKVQRRVLVAVQPALMHQRLQQDVRLRAPPASGARARAQRSSPRRVRSPAAHPQRARLLTHRKGSASRARRHAAAARRPAACRGGVPEESAPARQRWCCARRRTATAARAAGRQTPGPAGPARAPRLPVSDPAGTRLQAPAHAVNVRSSSACIHPATPHPLDGCRRLLQAMLLAGNP